MLFSCLGKDIEHRFLDTSQQAAPSVLFPLSLGLRSQAMKLSFLRQDVKGWFIRPQVSSKQAMEAVIRQHTETAASKQQTIHQALIGEAVSLIYAPFYDTGEQMMDAVLNQPVSSRPVASFDPHRLSGGPAFNCVHFMATICPECGWDLKGNRDALALHCTNCKSVWRVSRKGLLRVAAAHLPPGNGEPTLFLPFWRIRAKIDGMDLHSYADLVKHTNLPQAIRPEWHQIPMHFWGPAFKVRPRSFLRLTHQITRTQPSENLIPEMPDGHMHPVTLPVAESVQTLKLNLAGILRPKKKIQAHMQDLHIEPEQALLVYLPFSIHHHDLVQTTFGIAVNRNQLALAGNL